MLRVLIFEPDFNGHRLTYVKHIVRGLADLPVEVTLALGEDAPSSEEFASQISGIRGKVNMDSSVVLPSGRSTLGQALARYEALRGLVKRHRPDHVYVPYADGLSQVMGLRRPVPLGRLPERLVAEGLMMRGSYAYAPPPSLRDRIIQHATLRALALAPWHTLFHIDPFVYESLRRGGASLREKVRLIPDPVEPVPELSQSEARESLGIPPVGRYILFSGRADERKGADLLIRAFARCRLAPNDRLWLAGKLAPRILGLVSEVGSELIRSGRIVIWDRYLSDQELAAANRAADLVCVPYPRHIGSASLVIRAAAAHRRVLGSSFGWIKWAIESFELGATCDVTDIERFAAALAQNLDAALTFKPSDRAQRFVDFHSVPNFQAVWTRELRKRLKWDELPVLEWPLVN